MIHNEYTQENPRINRQDRQKITFHGSAYPKTSQQCTPTTHTEAVHCQRVLLGVFHPCLWPLKTLRSTFGGGRQASRQLSEASTVWGMCNSLSSQQDTRTQASRQLLVTFFSFIDYYISVWLSNGQLSSTAVMMRSFNTVHSVLWRSAPARVQSGTFLLHQSYFSQTPLQPPPTTHISASRNWKYGPNSKSSTLITKPQLLKV